jgi:hypothetical protein
MNEGIPGNPEALSAAELHARACASLDSYFRKVHEDETRRYQELVGAERASHDLETIIRASYQGKVELLFVAVGVQKWGRVDMRAGKILFCQQSEPDSEDLLDFATIQTLLNGGSVRVVLPENVPAEGLAAAIFRY